MNPKLHHLLADCEKNEGATSDAIGAFLKKCPVLPQDYVETMRQSNGIEGWIGKNAYLMLYPVEQLLDINRAAQVDDFAPGMIICGSNGGGMTYAFDTRIEPVTIVEVPSEVLSWDEVWTVWDSFIEFLEALARRE